MGDMQKFEELVVWKKVRKLTENIYNVTKDKQFSQDRELVSQIRRASVSVMSNIAEGKERGGGREFAQFLQIAKGSAGEIRSQLYVAKDQNYIAQKIFEELIELSTEVSRLLSGLIKKL